jgi:TPP-dependent indolepyruvate ferredoxin oxidoreductase alpha subunit
MKLYLFEEGKIQLVGDSTFQHLALDSLRTASPRPAPRS